MAGETFHHRVDAPWSEAEQSLLQIAPTARISSGADLRHRLDIDGDERFSFLRFTLHGQFDAVSEPDDSITITQVLTGWMHWAIGDDRGVSAQPWMQALDRPTFSRFGALDEIALFLKREQLTEFGRALYGDDDFQLRFDGPLPIDSVHGVYFAAALSHAQRAAGLDAFEEPVFRATLYRHVAVSLFASYRLHGDHAARAITAEGRLRRYRIAAQFIDDHASLPITIEDAAQAAGTSVRDLESIFLAHSPSGAGVRQRLRSARLAAAHEDLVRGDPTLGDTVRAIAYRWGFSSPSTFARQYREAYGVNPKQMLDR